MIHNSKQRKQTTNPDEETLLTFSCERTCERFGFDKCPEGVEITGTKYSVDDQYIRSISRHGITLPPSLISARTKRQVEYLAGRYCAITSLQTFGQKTSEIGINDDGSPGWPMGFTGAITHSKGLAIAAVANRSAVRFLGVDAEQWVTAARAEKLSRAILLDSEVLYSRDQELPVEWFFTLVFSAKESLYKLLRSEVGRYFGFHSASIISLDIEKQSFILMLTESLSPEFNEGYLFNGCYQEQGDHMVTLVYFV